MVRAWLCCEEWLCGRWVWLCGEGVAVWVWLCGRWVWLCGGGVAVWVWLCGRWVWLCGEGVAVWQVSYGQVGVESILSFLQSHFLFLCPHCQVQPWFLQVPGLRAQSGRVYTHPAESASWSGQLVAAGQEESVLTRVGPVGGAGVDTESRHLG